MSDSSNNDSCICKRCNNTGSYNSECTEESFYCGCIIGEARLNADIKKRRENYPERLAYSLVKQEVISKLAMEHGKEKIIAAVKKALEETTR